MLSNLLEEWALALLVTGGFRAPGEARALPSWLAAVFGTLVLVGRHAIGRPIRGGPRAPMAAALAFAELTILSLAFAPGIERWGIALLLPGGLLYVLSVAVSFAPAEPRRRS